MKTINRFLTVIILSLTVLFAHAQSDKSQRAGGLQSQTIKVSGLCNMDKQRIEKAAASVDGVHAAIWDQNTQTLQLTYSVSRKAAVDEVERRVAAAGNDTEKYRASDIAYQQLPDCCHYRTKRP